MRASSAAASNILILTPVFNDWESLAQLLVKIDEALARDGRAASVIVVDDGSSQPAPEHGLIPGRRIKDLTLIRLVSNQGHQSAIATGLAYIFKHRSCAHIVIMDCDGEDRPEDLPDLIDAAVRVPGSVVVASRARRSEGRLFATFYVLFKALFRVLTGHVISFGNYCVIPCHLLEAIVYRPELWSHIPALLIKLKLPIIYWPTARGTRYRGRSSMNVVSLILHGLNAINVFADQAVARILIACLFALAAATCGVLAVVAIRLGTTLAIPGWATNVFGILVLFMIQIAAIGLFAVFTLLSLRKITPSLPIEQFERWIKAATVTIAHDRP
jgi:polyisoprenyl-phosphate glycosyltransferase